MDQGFVFKDKWILRQSMIKIITPLALALDDNAMVDKIISQLGGWNNDLLDQSFLAEDVATIQSIPISSGRCGDKNIWHFEESGNFSVKSGYQMARRVGKQTSSSNMDSSVYTNWWKRLWKMKIP